MAEKRCFVISPIGAKGSEVRHHADDVFRFIIQPAMEEFDIAPVRSDQMPETGRITQQMFEELVRADMCIAILTGLNPNVFYEVAVAQSASRPMVILIEEGEALPFDVQDLRCITYSMKPISQLIDGLYAERVKEQVRIIKSQGWLAPTIYEQFDCTPRFRHEYELRRFLRRASPKPLVNGIDRHYALPSDPQRKIVILTGDIDVVLGEEVTANVVTSLEGTNLQLARFYEASVSGALRYLDAEKSEGGQVRQDSLQESLNERMRTLGIHPPALSGTVVATPTSQLAKYGVKYVFHIAALQGVLGHGYRCNLEVLDTCIPAVFERFAKLSSEEDLESLAFPMLGAETSEEPLADVVTKLLHGIVRGMGKVSSCRTVYLVAQLESHLDVVHQIAETMGLDQGEPPAASGDEAGLDPLTP